MSVYISTYIQQQVAQRADDCCEYYKMHKDDCFCFLQDNLAYAYASFLF